MNIKEVFYPKTTVDINLDIDEVSVIRKALQCLSAEDADKVNATPRDVEKLFTEFRVLEKSM